MSDVTIMRKEMEKKKLQLAIKKADANIESYELQIMEYQIKIDGARKEIALQEDIMTDKKVMLEEMK